MSAPAKTSAKTSAQPSAKRASVPAPTPSNGTPKVPTQAGLKPDSDQLDLKIPDELGLATPLGPALELIPQDPDAREVTKGARGPITKKRKRPAGHAASSGRAEKSGGSGRAEKAGGRRREKAPPVALIIGIPVLLLGVGVVFLLGGGKPTPPPAPKEAPAPKREPAAVFIPKGLNDPPPAPAAASAPSTPAPGDAPAPPPAKPGSGRTPEEREAARLAEEEIAAQKRLIEERTKRLGGEPGGAGAPAPATPPPDSSE